LLRENGIEPEIVEYLKTPLDAAQLADVLKKLDVPPHYAVRAKESPYPASGLSPDSSLKDICTAIAAEPILLERPIVVKNNQAIIARPPENALKLL
jgi:arsenate reductase